MELGQSSSQESENNMARQHNMYSSNQNDLHNPRNLNSRSLYPNFGNALSIPSQENNNMYPNPYASGVYDTSSHQNNLQLPQHQLPSDINCVTCDKMFEERIYQCNQEHNSCELCKVRQVPCGQCRQQLTNRRNLVLEKHILEKKKVKCPNSMDGCTLSIKIGDMLIHEKQCPFKALECPSLGSSCNWKGKLSQLADHFNEMHPLHNEGEVDKEMVMTNITNTSHTMHYIQIENFNFLFHVKVSEPDARIYMAVQLIGPKERAAKWNYEIHIYKNNGSHRKYKYMDRCISHSDPLQEVFSSTKCVVIPQECAKQFLWEGVLAYKFYVKRSN